MGAIVAFDYIAWAQRYPEFGTAAQPLVSMYFQEACLYQRNDGGGPINDPNAQLMLLNMLTAHIAALNAGVNGNPASPLVGNITAASEGTVNVTVTNDYPPGSPQWFQQTKYGAAWWAATSIYRKFRYRTPKTYVADPWRDWR